MRKELLALLGFLRKQIGLRSDTASASGSLHAKTNYLIAQSNIKSIQRGTISLGASATTASATISAVNTNKVMVNLLGVSAGNAFSLYNLHYSDNSTIPDARLTLTSHHFVRLALTNGTTVTATREVHNSTAAIVSYEVIEFY